LELRADCVHPLPVKHCDSFNKRFIHMWKVLQKRFMAVEVLLNDKLGVASKRINIDFGCIILVMGMCFPSSPVLID